MKFVLPVLLLLVACNPPATPDATTPTGTTADTARFALPPPVQDGFEQLRGPDGKVVMEGYKRGGQRHGLWTSYTKDARVKSKNTYTDGKLHGECIVFRENGQVYYTGTYTDGKETGTWKFYGPDGTLVKTVEH